MTTAPAHPGGTLEEPLRSSAAAAEVLAVVVGEDDLDDADPEPVEAPPGPTPDPPPPVAAGDTRPPPGMPLAVEDALRILREYLDAAPPRAAPDGPGPAEARAALDDLAHLGAAADDLLPLGVVAARLSVSIDTVRRLIAQDQLEAVRIGYRTMRVSVGALDRYRASLDVALGRQVPPP